MSVEPSTHREYYLHPGAVGASLQNLEWGSSILCNLLRNGQNRMDFVRSGNADVLARTVDSAHTDDYTRAKACEVLCVVAYDWENDRNTAGSEEGEELSLDTMRETFMRAPGRMDLLLQFKDTRDKLHIFTALAKNQRLVRELLAHPGVVQLVSDEVGGFAFRLEVEECLRRVLGNDPTCALGYDPIILALTNRAACQEGPASRQFHHVMLQWHLALAQHARHGGGGGTNDHLSPLPRAPYGSSEDSINADLAAAAKKDLLAFWSNLPLMWALVANTRTKKRSAVRHLPVDLFRLLREMLCGGGGVWYVHQCS